MQTIEYTANRTEEIVCQRFDVHGMCCQHCELALIASLVGVEGIAYVTVDAAGSSVTVESTTLLDIETVASAIADAGYELVR